jgi:hypothetical protein
MHLPMAYAPLQDRVVMFDDMMAAINRGGAIQNIVPPTLRGEYEDCNGRVLISDFAGRDSVAACLQALQEDTFDTIIPIGDVVPSRYGDWESYEENWLSFAQIVRQRHPTVDLKPWFLIDFTALWSLINVELSGIFQGKNGWFTPCVGCHLHFYGARAVLADAFDHRVVLVSGEKRLHQGGKRKANQTDAALNGYRALASDSALDHRFPIHGLDSEQEMEDLLGQPWPEGGRQMRCTHSGNDRDKDGVLKFSEDDISSLLNEFLLPIVRTYLRLSKVGLDHETRVHHIRTLFESGDEA